jgi:CheY-like chemotaxis protein
MIKNTHILLAEDNNNDVELILAALRDRQLAREVVVVNDGADALDYLYCQGVYTGRITGLPGVVFLDLKMPRVDGLEVLRRIKSDPILRHVPVVMLTSSREDRDIVLSYDLGVNAFVVKPVDFRKFMETIQSVGVFWGLINEHPPTTSSG